MAPQGPVIELLDNLELLATGNSGNGIAAQAVVLIESADGG